MTAIIAILKRIPLWVYVALILGIIIGIQTLRLHWTSDHLAIAKAQESAYLSAQATNLATIKQQQIALDGWSTKYAAGIKNAHAMAALAIASAIKSANEATAARTQLKVIYEHAPPSVQACGKQPAPVAAVDQLRHIAGGKN